MKIFNKGKKATVFLALVLAGTLGFNTFDSMAQAGYFNTYSDISSINNSTYTTCQGFAAGSTYAYSAKINGANGDKAILLKTNMDSGETVVLTNEENNQVYNSYLAHANDMTVCSLNGKSNLFIATGKSTIVQVKVDGRKYKKVKQYNLKLGANSQEISGINIVSKTDNLITFLFKKGRSFYSGSINPASSQTDISLTKKFEINVSDALVNGAKIADLGEYTHQGFTYSSATDSIYVPLWGGKEEGKPNRKKNVSVVLVYKNVSSAANTITADNSTSFRVTSSKYTTFEIESCGIRNGQLWFNTNRAGTNGQADGVHCFKEYKE